MRRLRRIAVVATMLLLAVCASASAHIDTTGSVTTKNGSFVRYPDGAVVRITAVRELPHDACDIKTHHACVYVVATFRNTGSKPIVLGDYGQLSASVALRYGLNEYDANAAVGYEGHSPPEAQIPLRCVPGTAFRISNTFSVPTSGLSHLQVSFEASLAGDQNLTPYTFTNVQTLLKH